MEATMAEIILVLKIVAVMIGAGAIVMLGVYGIVLACTSDDDDDDALSS